MNDDKKQVEKIKDNQDFTTGSIFKKLTAFMFPTLGALILQAMYGAVDLLIVGRFGTTAGISGVATGTSILNMFTFILVSIAVGVTVLMGQYLGAKQNEKIGKLLGNAVAFFAAMAILFTLILIFLARPIAILLQAPEEALDLTVQYIRICGAGFIFIVAYNFISCIFKGMGDSKLPFIFVSIACVANIIGDLVLVKGFNMNVAGAAIATVAAQAISVVLSLIIIKKKKFPFKFSVKDIRFGSEIPKFVKIGIPLALQEFLTSISFLALTAFINILGLEASSGYGVAQKIQQFVMLIPSSLMQSMGPFVAQNVGAKNEKRARSAMLCGMGIGCSVGLCVGLLLFFKGNLVSELFTSDANVIKRSFEFMRGFAPEAIVTSILFSYMGYFNGHSKSLFVMIQGIAQSFLVRLPMSFIMSRLPNASLTWIGLAAPTATVFGIILCLIYYKIMGKNLERK